MLLYPISQFGTPLYDRKNAPASGHHDFIIDFIFGINFEFNPYIYKLQSVIREFNG
ncbi:hypothetical protein D3C75_493980 [compost metagenome]